MQNFDHAKRAVLYTGTSGTGKTTAYEKRIRGEKARVKYVFDWEGEYSARFKHPRITDPGELDYKAAQGGYVIFDPCDLDGPMQKHFEGFCEYVFLASEKIRGTQLFCCDEIQKFVNPDEPPEAFLQLLERGRRREVDIFCIAQAPNRIHNAVRNQFTEVVSFRQTDKNALIFLEDQGMDPEKIRNLKNGQWIAKNIKTGEFSEGGKPF